jgi:hypothetical protein
MWQMGFATEWQMPLSHKHDQISNDTLFNQTVTSELGKWYHSSIQVVPNFF